MKNTVLLKNLGSGSLLKSMNVEAQGGNGMLVKIDMLGEPQGFPNLCADL